MKLGIGKYILWNYREEEKEKEEEEEQEEVEEEEAEQKKEEELDGLTVFLLSVSSGSSKQSMTAIWWSLAYWGKSFTMAASPLIPMYFKLCESLLMNLQSRIDR